LVLRVGYPSDVDQYGDNQGLWVGIAVGGAALGLLLLLLVTTLNLAECEQRGDVIRRYNDHSGPRYSEVYPVEWELWVKECRD
jgi:hypothetical protein